MPAAPVADLETWDPKTAQPLNGSSLFPSLNSLSAVPCPSYSSRNTCNGLNPRIR